MIKTDEFCKCLVCVEAQHAKKHFKFVIRRKTKLHQLIHLDLADLKNSVSKDGKKYYITFIDEFSRYTKAYFLKSKDEAKNIFLKFKAKVKNRLDRKIKRF